MDTGIIDEEDETVRLKEHVEESEDDGFTLIEVMISVVVLGLLSVGVLIPLVWSQNVVSEQQKVVDTSSTVSQAFEHIRHGGSGDCAAVQARVDEIDGKTYQDSQGTDHVTRAEFNRTAIVGIEEVTVYAEYPDDPIGKVEQSEVTSLVRVDGEC